MSVKQKPSNPFISKTPVRGKYFFGRDDLLKKIFGYINAGESVSLVGERRTGKTSILLRVLDLKEQLLSQPDRHVFVLLDFLGLDYRDETDIWITLLTALSQAVALADLEAETIARANEQLRSGELVSQTLLGLFRTLANDGIKVTFLFDEFEATAQEKNPVDLSFYKILRNLAIDEKTSLTYIIATRQELSKVELLLERQFTTLTSPLFNIFHQLVIAPFSEEEARQMANGLLQSTDLDWGTILSFWLQQDLLFQLSGFHPFFLQIACYQLFEHCVLSDGAFSDQVPEDEIVSAFLGEASSHFSYYWDISSAEERELMGQLARGGDDVDIQSHRPTAKNLENRCLIARDAEAKAGWRLFSSVFARWIKEQQQQLAAWYNEGMDRLAVGQLEQARASFEKVYERQPDYRDVVGRLKEIEIEKELKGLRKIAATVRVWWTTRDRPAKLALMGLFGITVLALCLGTGLAAGLPFLSKSTATPTEPTATLITTSPAPLTLTALALALTPTSTPTLTSMPTATPIPSPIPTETPTTTSTPFPTPTDTPIPPTPTETLVPPTATPMPPTDTPTPEPPTSTPTYTPTPTATQVLLELLEPLQDAEINVNRIDFKWAWKGAPLAGDEYFALRMWNQEHSEERHSITWTDEPKYTLALDHSPITGIKFGPGYYYWNIGVVRELCPDHQKRECWEALYESEPRRLYIKAPPPPDIPTPIPPTPTPVPPTPTPVEPP